jgi:DNA modification methylase
MTATPPPASTGQNASAPYTLHHGDCLDVLRGMADNSVDSVVTDPPYGLSFMGSGSTGKSAMLEGFRFVGIEREAEYVAIAEARIKAAMASTPAAPAAPETMPLFDQSPEGATA